MLPLGYIGPGAGFALMGSFLVLFAAIALAILALAALPVRMLAGLFRRKRVRGGIARRVIVVGMDGLDPRRVRRMMEHGDMPNFVRMTEQGCFSDLETTCPPISPVAWSSFATGVNPGKHGIFDFLSRDLKTYTMRLSSSRVRTSRGVFGQIRSKVELLRRSKPFWKVLGEHGIFSTILRVPVTYPPERFFGACLSGMCVPDLRGTQGSFTVFESGDEGKVPPTGGMRIHVPDTDRFTTHLPGPTAGNGREMKAELQVRINRKNNSAVLEVSGRKVLLESGSYSPWMRMSFRSGWHKATGMCRFLMVSAAEPFKMYVTPINIDPSKPAMPVSHPSWYSIHLAGLHGQFATLGLAEDTWALNEGAISDLQFLRQTNDIQVEREKMFFEAIKRTREGVCCCVFDLTDRVQHMFLRMETEGHGQADCRDAIHNAYKHMDQVLGRVMAVAGRDTVVFVVSDHGFGSFSRGLNLNAWLREQGYLVLKDIADDPGYLGGIDWSKTRAYAFGLSGVYVNRRGREGQGIVADADAAALKNEIATKLAGLRDPATDASPVRTVYDTALAYSGPYSGDGPDLVVGYADGWRASWDTAVGRVGKDVLADNEKCWSGDHCMDHKLVPGVFLCNRRIATDEPGKTHVLHITDMAPTILRVLGVGKPAYMDGTALSLVKQESKDK